MAIAIGQWANGTQPWTTIHGTTDLIAIGAYEATIGAIDANCPTGPLTKLYEYPLTLLFKQFFHCYLPVNNIAIFCLQS